MTAKKIAVIVGSLRKESFNRKMANVLMTLAPQSLHLEIVEIDGLPLYNQDFDDEGHPPDAWKNFRQKVSGYDGILFVTPEYNRSIPGVLKNALDVGSRPYGKSVWNEKPAAIVSVSTGAIGGFGANHHLRQSMVFLNVPVMQHPEAYIGGAAKLFSLQGSLMDKNLQDYMQKFMLMFDSWVERNLSSTSRQISPPEPQKKPEASL